jgi:hypothetical protein
MARLLSKIYLVFQMLPQITKLMPGNRTSPLKTKSSSSDDSPQTTLEGSYKFHESCPCVRLEKSREFMSNLESNLGGSGDAVKDTSGFSSGWYSGASTCNDYTTALGFGQDIVAYSFYEPLLIPGQRS